MTSLSIAVHALALTLLCSLWQGALVALALAVALRVLRRAAPASRYVVACSALVALLVAPVLTFASIHRALAATARRALPPLPLLGAPPAPPQAYLPLLVSAAWAAGVSLMLLRLAGGHLRVRRLVAESAPLGADLGARLERLAAQLGVRREVLLRASDAITVPAVVGWLRPVVLLPVAVVSGMPPSAIEAILAHELAHVRRHDYLVNALQSAAEALLFYHPAAWWVSRVIRAEREHASDDRAVAVLADPAGYARALAAAEALRSPLPMLGIAFTGGPLMSRVRRLLSSPPAPRRAPLALAIAAALVALGACTALAGGDGEGRAALTAPALPEAVARWMPQLSAAGTRHGVDPDLLAAVTLVESGGDPDAKSPNGALGLMQIMPDTGEKIAAARGLADHGEDRLRDPAYNVDLGAWYLAQQIHAFADPDPERTVALAAAAYNAGPDAVRAYLAGGGPLPDETTRYQAKVTALWKDLHAAR
jgi:beta-lactamase regulating signal transducer with metallopeptidase domain